MKEPGGGLKICLDARLLSGQSGGVEQYVIGLAKGFSELDDGSEEYLFLTFSGEDEWLRPHLGGGCRLINSTEAPFSATIKGRLKRAIPFAETLLAAAPPLPGFRRAGPSPSEGTIESLGVRVMHFTGQQAFLTDVPTIYQPHDLQHVHLPKMFSPRERFYREKTYRLHCGRAQAVVMMTSWGARDVVEHFGLPKGKIWSIAPGAALPVSSGDCPDDLKLALPDSFLIYPAQTWPHKNHLRLLEALARVRETRGTNIALVCTGAFGPHHRAVTNKVAELKLQDQVWFTGFVHPETLRWLYSRATGLIFPSMFEGWGMPITEAFATGLPVACSNVTSLPDLVLDGAVIFDPRETEEIGAAALTLWEDGPRREALAKRGLEIADRFSWRRTALMLRALYRRLEGIDDESDRELLARPPLV